MEIEAIIGIAIWVGIFLVWYVKTYPEKVRGFMPSIERLFKGGRTRRAASSIPRPVAGSERDFKKLVEAIESICARDRMGSADAATMVDAVRKLLTIEPASAQIWEALALDSLETARITCDDCRIPVEKTVKKTGVRISCSKCGKWLALKNSKVTVIDPNRPDLEEWEQ